MISITREDDVVNAVHSCTLLAFKYLGSVHRLTKTFPLFKRHGAATGDVAVDDDPKSEDTFFVRFWRHRYFQAVLRSDDLFELDPAESGKAEESFPCPAHRVVNNSELGDSRQNRLAGKMAENHCDSESTRTSAEISPASEMSI